MSTATTSTVAADPSDSPMGGNSNKSDSRSLFTVAVVVVMMFLAILSSFLLVFHLNVRRRIQSQFSELPVTRSYMETRKEVMRVGSVIAISMQWVMICFCLITLFNPRSTFVIICIWSCFSVIRVITVTMSAKFATIVVSMHSRLLRQKIRQAQVNSSRLRIIFSVSEHSNNIILSENITSFVTFLALIALFGFFFGLIVAASVNPRVFNAFNLFVSLCELINNGMLYRSTRFVTKKTDKSAKRTRKSLSQLEFDRQWDTIFHMKTLLLFMIYLMLYPCLSIVSSSLRLFFNYSFTRADRIQRLPFIYTLDALFWSVYVSCVVASLITYSWIDYDLVQQCYTRSQNAAANAAAAHADTSRLYGYDEPESRAIVHRGSMVVPGALSILRDATSGSTSDLHSMHRRGTTGSILPIAVPRPSVTQSELNYGLGLADRTSGARATRSKSFVDPFGVTNGNTLWTMDLGRLMQTGYTVEKLFNEVARHAGTETIQTQQIRAEVHKELYDSEYSVSRQISRTGGGGSSVTGGTAGGLPPSLEFRRFASESTDVIAASAGFIGGSSSASNSVGSSTTSPVESGEDVSLAVAGREKLRSQLGGKKSMSTLTVRNSGMKVLKEDQVMTPIKFPGEESGIAEMPDIEEIAALHSQISITNASQSRHTSPSAKRPCMVSESTVSSIDGSVEFTDRDFSDEGGSRAGSSRILDTPPHRPLFLSPTKSQVTMFVDHALQTDGGGGGSGDSSRQVASTTDLFGSLRLDDGSVELSGYNSDATDLDPLSPSA